MTSSLRVVLLVGVERVFRTASGTGSVSVIVESFDSLPRDFFEGVSGADFFVGVSVLDDVRRVLRAVAGVVEGKASALTVSILSEFSGMGDNLVTDITVAFWRLGVRTDGEAATWETSISGSPASELADLVLVRFRVDVSGAGEAAVDDDFRALRLSPDFGVSAAPDFFSGVFRFGETAATGLSSSGSFWTVSSLDDFLGGEGLEPVTDLFRFDFSATTSSASTGSSSCATELDFLVLLPGVEDFRGSGLFSGVAEVPWRGRTPSIKWGRDARVVLEPSTFASFSSTTSGKVAVDLLPGVAGLCASVSLSVADVFFRPRVALPVGGGDPRADEADDLLVTLGVTFSSSALPARSCRGTVTSDSLVSNSSPSSGAVWFGFVAVSLALEALVGVLEGFVTSGDLSVVEDFFCLRLPLPVTGDASSCDAAEDLLVNLGVRLPAVAF